MDWSRPENVQEIAATYSSYDIVGEIIILILKPCAPQNYPYNKVRVLVDYSANTRYGLASRFMGCSLSNRNQVIVQDDDYLHTEESLKTLADAATQHPDTVIGYYCRTWNTTKGTSHSSYTIRQAGPGQHPIALTNTLITPRNFCVSFFDYWHLVIHAVQGSVPYWNGEDIFFNLVSYKISNNMPRCIPAPAQGIKVMPYQVERGMSFINKGHLPYRRWFLAVAARALGVHQGLEKG